MSHMGKKRNRTRKKPRSGKRNMRGGRLTEEGLRFLINACKGVKPNVESIRTYLQNYHKDRADTFSKSDIKIYLGYMGSSISTKHEMFAVIKRKDREAAERERLGLDVKIPPRDRDRKHTERRRSRRRHRRHYPTPPPSPLSSSSSSSHGDDGHGSGRRSMFRGRDGPISPKGRIYSSDPGPSKRREGMFHSDSGLGSGRRRMRYVEPGPDIPGDTRLKAAEESERIRIADENSRAVPVVIVGATGPFAPYINGHFNPTREVGADGRLIYINAGNPNVCLEHVGGYWSVKPMSEKGTPSYYASVEGNCALLECSSRRWMLADGRRGSIPNPMIRLLSQQEYSLEIEEAQRRRHAAEAAEAAEAQRQRDAAAEAQRRRDAAAEAEAEARRRRDAEAHRLKGSKSKDKSSENISQPIYYLDKGWSLYIGDDGTPLFIHTDGRRERNLPDELEDLYDSSGQRLPEAAAAPSRRVPNSEQLVVVHTNDYPIEDRLRFYQQGPSKKQEAKPKPRSRWDIKPRKLELPVMPSEKNKSKKRKRGTIGIAVNPLDSNMSSSGSFDPVFSISRDNSLGSSGALSSGLSSIDSQGRMNRGRMNKLASDADIVNFESQEEVPDLSSPIGLGEDEGASLAAKVALPNADLLRLQNRVNERENQLLSSLSSSSSGLSSSGSLGSKNRGRMNKLASDADIVNFESQEEVPDLSSPIGLGEDEGASLAAKVALPNADLLRLQNRVNERENQLLSSLSSTSSASSRSSHDSLAGQMGRLKLQSSDRSESDESAIVNIDQPYNVTIQYTPEHNRKTVIKPASLRVTNAGVNITIDGRQATLDVRVLREVLAFNIARSIDMKETCRDTITAARENTAGNFASSKCVKVTTNRVAIDQTPSLAPTSITIPFTINFNSITDCDNFKEAIETIRNIDQEGGKKRNNTKKQSHRKTYKYIQHRRKYKTKKNKKSKRSKRHT